MKGSANGSRRWATIPNGRIGMTLAKPPQRKNEKTPKEKSTVPAAKPSNMVATSPRRRGRHKKPGRRLAASKRYPDAAAVRAGDGTRSCAQGVGRRRASIRLGCTKAAHVRLVD